MVLEDKTAPGARFSTLSVCERIMPSIAGEKPKQTALPSLLNCPVRRTVMVGYTRMGVLALFIAQSII